MRTRFHRQLVASAQEAASGRRVRVPPELGAHQFLLMLLYVAAELEHALMVQYLYAGYSLADHLLKPAMREQGAVWRETMFTIAKEEMGHLMTVQNLLRCLGGPLNFDREDYPWDPGFHPFPFQLEPLSDSTLARYIVAESHDGWRGKWADEVRANAALEGEPINRVGVLYDLILRLLKDEELIPDALFRAATPNCQASSDEWARGYVKPEATPNVKPASVPRKPPPPQLLILNVTSRADAIDAVKAVAVQGEAATGRSGQEPSHFDRFLGIYKAWHETPQSRLLVTNPVVAFDSDLHVEGKQPRAALITQPRARLWASLFNLRYRLLLTCLSRTFEFPNGLDGSSPDSPRGLLVNSTFGEMYNLRAIAGILTTYSATGAARGRRAGPPFQMPFTLKTPIDMADRWRAHAELLEASTSLAEDLLDGDANPSHEVTYLRGLVKLDRDLIGVMQGLGAGSESEAVKGQA